MIRLLVLLFILYRLVVLMTRFDRAKDKVYKLPKYLLGIAVAFVASFAVMTVMEKSGVIWMYDWAGVAAVAVFTLIMNFVTVYIEKDFTNKHQNNLKQ